MRYIFQALILVWIIALVGAVQTGAWSGVVAQNGDIITLAKWNEMVATFQNALFFADEGTNLGASGTVNRVNFVGSGISAVRSGNTVTVTATGTVLGGTNRQIQYNNGMVALGGATGGTIDASGNIVLGESPITTPAPSAGNVIFSLNRSGRRSFAFKDPNGTVNELQSLFATKNIGLWNAQWNGTTVSVYSFGNTVAGTATTRNIATTNQFTTFSRVGYVSAATAGSSAGTRYAALQFFAGNATTIGGYYYVARFGISHAVAVAQARGFVGLYGSAAAIGNVNPSTLTNVVGVSFDAAGTTWNFINNDTTAGAVITPTSASFPTNTLSTDMYELRIYCPPQSTMISMSLENLRTNTVAEYTATTRVPAVNTLLSPQIWINNGTTALAAGIDVASQYIETAY